MALADHRILQTLHRADVAAFLKVVRACSLPAWQTLAGGVSRSADGWLYPLIPLVVAAFSPATALQLFYVLALGYALERTCYFVLKNRIKRNRPPKVIPGFSSAIQAPDEFSLPSGHTSAAFLAVTILTLFFPGSLLACLYLWSIAVAASRVALGVHFPLDTVAGAVLGSLTALTIFNLLI